jgi:tryptophanyl-tRNA synthetase
MSIKTDSAPVDQPKNPETCCLFQIFRHFAPADRTQDVLRLYKEGGAAYGTIKKELVGILWDYFAAARAERARLVADPGFVKKTLEMGKQKASEIAAATLAEARRKVGVAY